MKKGLLIKYGEIAIRGKNRYIFENKLLNNIKNNINSFENYYLKKESGRFIIRNDVEEFNYDLIIPKITIIMGIIGICPCIIIEEQNINNIKKLCLEYVKENYDMNKNYTFKVETKRSNKLYFMTSREISSEVGAYLLLNLKNLKVDLYLPKITIRIELRTNIYIYTRIIKGLGGLPIGSSGRAMLLLSGGIDSPVAGFLMQKRGVEIEALYFHSPPYTSDRAKEKVIDLGKKLSIFSGNLKLNIVNFTDIQLMFYKRVPIEKFTIFLKRAMIKLADKFAEKRKCQGIVLGDSIGQVASQTMRSINAVESGAKMPILRPLLCFDKQEIIDLAKNIGTFEISIRPYEDCCTIFVAKHPETKPKTSIIESMETSIENLDEMIDIAIKNIITIDI